jgi:hypothetical protein
MERIASQGAMLVEASCWGAPQAYQLKFWLSKFTIRDGNQLIDVSSAACGSSSIIPIGATQQISHMQELCTILIQCYFTILIANLILMMWKQSHLL